MDAPDSTRRELEIVLCLDLSGSTNGIIEDFRENFWYITNQLKAMEPSPVIRMGVVGFSRPSFGKSDAYVKVLSNITDDLDAVAAAVFSLRRSIEKGDQHVVPALQTCMNLNWSRSSDAVKLIFLAGNGMVNTNGSAYEKISETAKNKGISIHTLYVLSTGNKLKELPAWRRIADISGGLTTEISINKTDTAAIWRNETKSGIALNNRLMQTIRWNVMPDVCRQLAVTADSGAFAAKPDEWMNRIAYKSSRQYSLLLERYGAYSALDGTPQEALGEDVFSRKIRETILETQMLLKECDREAPSSHILKHHVLYKSGVLKDEGNLRRAIVIFTMVSCGELAAPTTP